MGKGVREGELGLSGCKGNMENQGKDIGRGVGLIGIQKITWKNGKWSKGEGGNLFCMMPKNLCSIGQQYTSRGWDSKRVPGL